jgi:hypothetical protein
MFLNDDSRLHGPNKLLCFSLLYALSRGVQLALLFVIAQRFLQRAVAQEIQCGTPSAEFAFQHSVS